MARRTPSAVTKIPDVLGAEGREGAVDEMVAGMLGQKQRQKEELEVMRRANKHKPADKIPGLAKTYTERRRELDLEEQEIADEFPDSIIRITETLEKARAAG